MTANQASNDAILAWIADQLGEEDDAEEIERTRCFKEQLVELGLQLDDVLYVLRHVTSIRRDYEGGCYTVSGRVIDGHPVEIVIAPPSPKKRIRLVKIWRISE